MKAVYKNAIWIGCVCTVLVGSIVLVSVMAGPRLSRGLSPRDQLSSISTSPNLVETPRPTAAPGEAQEEIRLRIKAARETRNMNELELLGDEIEIKRDNLNVADYAALMLDVSNALSSSDFRDDKQYVLAQKFASLVLGKQLALPADLEAKLVLHLQEDIEYTKGQLSNAEWIEKRRTKSETWLRAWQHLNDAIDPNFNVNDLPLANVPLPAGVAGPAGLAPEQVKDPELRAQYQRAIDANNQKAERNRTQAALRRTRDMFSKVMEAYLVRSYSRLPDNVAELEANLKKYSVDASTRTIILDKLRSAE